ncbi:precorrin-3B synthase [Opitutaceae bacterium TAV5]|nr:precorrin-3B synthase [Opitutaceae bacterium TAV5]
MNTTVPTPDTAGFSAGQKEYLQGFMAGVAASGQFPFAGHTAGGQITASPVHSATGNLATPPPEDTGPTVFGTPLGELCKPERWKYEQNPLDIWDKLVAHAEADTFPDEADVFRFKFHGLFHVAPTQDSFMLRLRLPAGELTSVQLHGLADMAAEWGGGYSHITTRANLQIREFRPRDIVKVLTRLQELGLTSRGAGADNVRNITASPNSGFDPDELIDVRPFARGLHHYILNHRDLYGLPRKFNIAFDNGGSLCAAADTNDIGFFAVRVTDASLARHAAATAAAATDSAASPAVVPGVYFRVHLGGITGHQDFARDTGLLLKPSEVVAVAVAMLRVFNEQGDRTNRKKARLKYLLERWGVEKFVEATSKKLAFPLVVLPSEACEPRRPFVKHGWVGATPQAQPGLHSIGLVVPVGRLTARQMHRLADLAANYGSGNMRLTVWQNILIPDIPDSMVATASRSLERAGFPVTASSLTAGIVACTGNRGCKYSAADTKAHAIALGRHLDKCGLVTEQAVNFHFTGCPHSCAQHYCGDIGFVGAKLSDGSEGYHIVIGGGMGSEQGIAREIFRGVHHEEVPALVEKILRMWDARRQSGESFVAWTRRHSLGELQEMLS